MKPYYRCGQEAQTFLLDQSDFRFWLDKKRIIKAMHVAQRRREFDGVRLRTTHFKSMGIDQVVHVYGSNRAYPVNTDTHYM